MDYSATAKQIVEQIGGQENITSIAHCMTRLRFTLKDESVVDDKKVKNIPGVLGLQKQSGQYQVIVGTSVARYFAEIEKLVNIKASDSKPEQDKVNIAEKILNFISGCMQPLIPAIIAGGLLKVLLVILGPTIFNVLPETSDTYVIFSSLADCAFYFLPVFVAYTAAKRLGGPIMLTLMVSMVLIYPDIISLLGGEAATTLFGFIPVVHGSYASSVIPAMLIAILVKYLEGAVDKITPVWAKSFFVPLVVVGISGPIALCVLAPAGLIVGNGIMFIMNAIYSFSPWLALGLFGIISVFLTISGMHWAFVPTTLMAYATVGYDVFLLPGMLSLNLSQAGAAMAVAVKSRDPKMKQVAFPAALTVLLSGVSEPAIYGVNLKLKKPLYAACIASAIGGVMAGFVELKSYAFSVPSLVSVVQYISPDSSMNFVFAIIIAAVSFIIAFVLTLIIARDQLALTDIDGTETVEEQTAAGIEEKTEVSADLTVENPIAGQAIALSEVNDETFAGGILGDGYAVIPSEGKVYAPVTGTVSAVAETKHAIGLTSDSGIEMLIHVGLDTVQLNGKYFDPKVKEGDRVTAGTLILEFDKENIRKENYEITTPVLITNPEDYQLSAAKKGQVTVGEQVITLSRA